MDAINNSAKKIDWCRTLSARAIRGLEKHGDKIEGAPAALESLTEMVKVLDTPEAETSNLQPIFDLAKAALAKVEGALRDKAELAIVKRYELALGLLTRFQAKMDNGAELMEAMNDVAWVVAEPKEADDLQPAFDVVDRVLGAVRQHQDDMVVRAVTRTDEGWLVSREGGEGRYAAAYRQTDLHEQVQEWLAAKPGADADHRAVKAWRDAGYALLKERLDHPWGMCKCGKNKLMPWLPKGETTYRVSRECRDCHADSKPDPWAEATGVPSKPKHQVKKKGSAAKRKGKKAVQPKEIREDGKGGKRQGKKGGDRHHQDEE